MLQKTWTVCSITFQCPKCKICLKRMDKLPFISLCEGFSWENAHSDTFLRVSRERFPACSWQTSCCMTTCTPCHAPFPENTALYVEQIQVKGTKTVVVQWFQQQPKEFFLEGTHWQVHQWVGCITIHGIFPLLLCTQWYSNGFCFNKPHSKHQNLLL